MMLLCDSNGEMSMMRFGFLVSLVVGACTVCVGWYAVVNSLGGAETLVVSGSALMTTSGFAKSIQKKWEKVKPDKEVT